MNINIAICDDNKIFIDNMKTKIIKISKNMKCLIYQGYRLRMKLEKEN